MKLTLIFLVICLALALASAIRNGSEGRLVNRPKFDVFGPRHKRTPQLGVKGGGVRVHPLFEIRPKRPELSVRKGEYICGDKVCKLPAGVEPQNCNGMCQYPIL